MPRTTCLLLLLLLYAVPALARAQSSGSSHVTARLLPAISVTGTQDLDFGTIASTQVVTVLAKNGGRFPIQGTSNTPVLNEFTSPPSALGPNLALTSWAGLANTSPGNGGATAFVPVPGGTRSATLANNGRDVLWLGATLSATLAAPGTYSVPIVITVVYN
jgi:spore coat protein U-like protein